MSINLQEAVDFLLREGYLYKAIKQLKLSPKFYLEVGDIKGLQKTESFLEAWDKRYIQFIRDAEVPQSAEDSRGERYALNKYSTEGEKGFRIAIGQGVSYPRLVASTKLYYKSSIKLKVGIGRYMKEGLWRTDYDAFKEADESGNSQEHVKQQTSNGTHTAWQVG